MSKNFVLSKEQLEHFIVIFIYYRRNPNVDKMQLSEILEQCLKDEKMFDSWFNGIDVMN